MWIWNVKTVRCSNFVVRSDGFSGLWRVGLPADNATIITTFVHFLKKTEWAFIMWVCGCQSVAVWLQDCCLQAQVKNDILLLRSMLGWGGLVLCLTQKNINQIYFTEANLFSTHHDCIIHLYENKCMMRLILWFRQPDLTGKPNHLRRWRFCINVTLM